MSLIKNLHFEMDDFSLDVPELTLSDSGVTAIQGESGAGKTTLLNVLLGVYQPTGWSWQFKGEMLSSMSVRERRLGVVFQSYDLFPHLTAAENIFIVLKARHAKSEREKIEQQVEFFKKQLSLEKCWSTKAAHLSGGEKQRIALLRAVVSNPRMLLLDEPFSALDVGLRAESRLSINNFIHQMEIPVLLITHDQADVEALAHTVVQIKNGKIQ